ncbi:zf-TFIIB domain-containing protein [Phycisphaeraceae bacterium D3-23]
MQCPKCSAEMKTQAVDGIEVDQCTGCGGMWFDLREHDRLREKGGKAVASLDSGDRAKGAANNEERDIDCPRCGVQMVKLAHHEQTHIHYEQCATCGGAYFDAGEFDDLRELTLGERVKRLLPGLRRG